MEHIGDDGKRAQTQRVARWTSHTALKLFILGGCQAGGARGALQETLCNGETFPTAIQDAANIIQYMVHFLADVVQYVAVVALADVRHYASLEDKLLQIGCNMQPMWYRCGCICCGCNVWLYD